MKALKSIEQLKPWEGNPRAISEEALTGLRHSIGEFGDLACITYNKRSGNLVAGHQRMKVLREQHGDNLVLESGAVVCPNGDRFPVRVIDVDDAHEMAMNVAANNPHIAGEFTPALGPILEELEIELPDLSDVLRLGDLLDKDMAEDDVRPLNPKKPIERVWILLGIPATDYPQHTGALAQIEESENVVFESTIR